MKLAKVIIKLFIICFLCFNTYSQKNESDSLRMELFKLSEQDTQYVKILNELGTIYLASANDSCIIYSEKALRLAKSIDYKIGIGLAYENLGAFYNAKGEYYLALENFIECYKISEILDKRRSMSNIKNSIGNTYIGMEDYDKALDAYLQSYTIAVLDSINYMIGISSIGIGNVYVDTEEPEKALEYFEKARDVFRIEQADYPLSVSYTLIGNAYVELKEFDKAFKYFDKALSKLKKLNNEYGIAGTYQLISKAYYEKGDLFKALEYGVLAFNMFKERKAYDNLQKTSLDLAKIFHQQGNFQNAYKYLQFHIQYKDSVYSIDKNRQFLELETKYETEKKEKRIALMAKERKIVNSEKKRQKTIIISVSSGLGLVILFSVFLFGRYRITKRQKNIIEKQKSEMYLQKKIVENKNKEITDSINYAKRLQDAILPPSKLVKSYLLDSFILYKPKDIVAGDFYFMDVIEEGDKKRIYYVAADCTGHGVPGAMVSIVGANELKRCIQEFGLRKPGEILDKLSELVVKNFSQSEERIRDGMDLALCCLEIENEQIKRVHYAGANNPLWVINSKRKEVPENANLFKEGDGFEIKANKQAIGYTENIAPFDTHTIELEPGDTLYTFSDGYPDQFGGENLLDGRHGGKKLKSANFRKLLFEIQDKTMDEQLSLLDKHFEDWKGELEQLDDVCVIGVRL